MKKKKSNNTNKEPQQLPNPEPVLTEKEGDKIVESQDSTTNHSQSDKCNHPAITQPFVVKIESPKKKGLKTSEIVSIISLFISLGALYMTTKSFDKTSQSVDFTIDATKKQSRAYVVFDSINRFPITPDSILPTQYVLKNIGKTPAYKVSFTSAIMFKANESDVDTSFFYKDVPEYEPVFTMGADVSVTDRTGAFKINPAHYEAFSKMDSLFFVALKITYTDIYGERHKTTALIYRPFNEPFYSLCNRFNEGD